MGFCAEHAAAAAMITAGQNLVLKMVAVNWDGEILPPLRPLPGVHQPAASR